MKQVKKKLNERERLYASTLQDRREHAKLRKEHKLFKKPFAKLRLYNKLTYKGAQ